MKAALGIALTLLAPVAWALWTPDLARIARSPLHINATPFYVMETLFALGCAGNWTKPGRLWLAQACWWLRASYGWGLLGQALRCRPDS